MDIFLDVIINNYFGRNHAYVECPYQTLSLPIVIVNYEDCQTVMKCAKYNMTKLFPPYTGQDVDNNITRFLILSREPITPGIDDRPYKV